MIDNLTEAIAHYKERARTYIDTLKPFGNKPLLEATKRYIARQQEFARKYEQLADWLEELAERREIDRWISVDEALPEKEGWYLVDRKERTSSIQYFFFSTVNHKPYWSGECKVYYWRPLPERYKESEDK